MKKQKRSDPSFPSFLLPPITSDRMRGRPVRLYVILGRIAGTTEWKPWFVTGSRSHAMGFYHDPPSTDAYDAFEVVPYLRARFAEGRMRR